MVNHSLSPNQLSSNDTRFLWGVICLSFITTFTLGLAVLLFDTYDEYQEDVEDLLASIDRVLDSSETFAKELNSLTKQDCSYQHQADMQSLLANQMFVRDIHFKTNAVDCSTAFESGSHSQAASESIELSTRLKLIKPPARGDIKRGIDSTPSFSLVNGNYELYFSRALISALLPIKETHEVVYLSAQGDVHISGKPGVYTQRPTNIAEWLSAKEVVVAECSENIPFCIALTISKKELWKEILLPFSAVLSLALLVSVWSRVRIKKQIIKKYFPQSRVRKGLEEDNFYCLYQPIIDMQSQQVIGCEVLARFKDQYGALYPDLFIPLIKELGHSWDFTEQLFGRAIKELKSYSELPEGFRVNFNVYPQDVSNNSISNLANSEIVNCRFSLVLEIIEDQYLEDAESHENLAAIQSNGFKVAIDDFGTGYSNLKQLRKLKCEYLKIDRSFVNDLTEDSIRSSLVPNIVEMGHKSGLEIVAEGIETKDQYQKLCQMGVEYGQGWLFGKAMPAAELEQFLLSYRDIER